MDVSLVQGVLIWAVLFTLVIYVLKKKEIIGDTITSSGPIVMWRTQFGIKLIERISKISRRGMRRWGDAGVIMSYIGLIGSAILVVVGFTLILNDPSGSAIEDPSQAVVIPGVNEFLPLSMAPEIILALLISLIVHEGGHAILSRTQDIDVESTGLFFFAGIPMGAFVEPSQDGINGASYIERLRMYSAGIANNVLLTFVVILLLFGPVGMFIGTVSGAHVGGVVPNSSANDADLKKGSVIVGVNGQEVTSNEEAEQILSETNSAQLELANGETTQFQKKLTVTEAPTTYPLIGPESVITSIDGTEVQNEQEYANAIAAAGDNSVLVSMEDAPATTLPAGIILTPTEEGNLSNAGLPAGQEVLLRSVDGDAITNPDELSAYLNENAGQTVQLSVVVGPNEQQRTVQVSEDGTIDADAGVGIYQVGVTEDGLQYYPTAEYLSLLTFGGEHSIVDRIIAIIFLPVAGLLGQLGFAGFTPEIQNFVTVSNIPESLEFAWFFIGSLCYWTAWININLAIFNCVPTYGLDGGHILNASVGVVTEKLNLSTSGKEVGSVFSHTVKLTMLIGLSAVLFAPILF